MLTFRQQEREKKCVSAKAEKARASHRSLGAEKDEDESFRQYVADGRRNCVLPSTTTHLLPKEITAVDPFNAFPIKLQPYMLDLLLSCRFSLDLFLASFCLPSVCL
jgi:hypothetical protein